MTSCKYFCPGCGRNDYKRVELEAELAFMTSERDYLLGSVDPKLTALREALRWTIESIDTTDWSEDGIEMLDSARQLYLDTREAG